jgi:hypothetical protein
MKRKLDQKLEDIIPSENIKAYLHIYRQIHAIEYDDSLKGLGQLNNDMLTVLTKAKVEGFITPQEKQELWQQWSVFCFNKISSLGDKYHLEILKQEFKSKPHRPPDNDINFLLYALYKDMQIFSAGHKPHYSLIVDFLEDNMEIHDFDYENIRQRIKTIRLASVHEALMIYHDYFKDKDTSLLPDDIQEHPTGFLEILCQWFK